MDEVRFLVGTMKFYHGITVVEIAEVRDESVQSRGVGIADFGSRGCTEPSRGKRMTPLWNDRVPTSRGGKKVIQGHQARLLDVGYSWHDIVLKLRVNPWSGSGRKLELTIPSLGEAFCCKAGDGARSGCTVNGVNAALFV
jgi:hypothetical protein